MRKNEQRHYYEQPQPKAEIYNNALPALPAPFPNPTEANAFRRWFWLAPVPQTLPKFDQMPPWGLTVKPEEAYAFRRGFFMRAKSFQLKQPPLFCLPLHSLLKAAR